jgi:hypothetical protein
MLYGGKPSGSCDVEFISNTARRTPEASGQSNCARWRSKYHNLYKNTHADVLQTIHLEIKLHLVVSSHPHINVLASRDCFVTFLPIRAIETWDAVNLLVRVCAYELCE